MEEEKIQKQLSRYEAALNSSSTKDAVDLYADDGIFMPTEAPTARGREQLVAAYNHVFSAIKLRIKFTVDEIVVSGNVAFARTASKGEVTVLSNKVTGPEENREFFLFVKVGDDWKISRYMFNKARPSR